MHASNVLAQLEAWVLAREGDTSGPCNVLQKRSLAGLRHRVRLLVEPRTPSDAELQLLRRRAMTHRALPGPVVFASRPDSPRPSYKRPPAPLSRPSDHVIGISRVSGRQRKMPGKFKEPPQEPAWRHRKPASEGRRDGSVGKRPATPSARRAVGLSRQNSRSILSVSKASKASRAAEPVEVEGGGDDTSARVGDDYQADVPGQPQPRDCHERADELLWSPTASALPAAELDAYVSSALPHLGGPPQDPPNQVPPRPPCGTREVLIRAGVAKDGACPPEQRPRGTG